MSYCISSLNFLGGVLTELHVYNSVNSKKWSKSDRNTVPVTAHIYMYNIHVYIV